MDERDLDEALRHDEALKQQVAANKAKNRPPASIPVPPERMQKIAQAQALRTQLGGYSTLPPDVRANSQVRKDLWPKVVDYVRLRMELAAEATMDALVVELRLSREEAGEALATASAQPAAPVPVGTEVTVAMPSGSAWMQKVVDLEARVAKLEARFDTSDV